MNAREMIKQAYKTPPKNEVVDEIDKLFKQAADPVEVATKGWDAILKADPKISKALATLQPAEAEVVMNAMKSNLTPSGLAGEVKGPVMDRLRAGGFIPSNTPSNIGQKLLSGGGKILSNAAPVMLAGAGLFGLSSLINSIRDSSKEKEFASQKEKAFNQLISSPGMKNMDKRNLKPIFDLYSDVSPLVVKHPMLAESLLREVGTGEAAINPAILKQLGELWLNKEKSTGESTKAKQTGWSLSASDPTKIRSLIGKIEG